MRRSAIMVDVDGVLITHLDVKGWSATLERDLGISAAELHRVFFENHWDDVVHGRAALRDRLTPALAKISPSVTCDALIEYWFSHDAHVDHRLLGELQVLRRQGIKAYLATVQEHERAAYLWNHLDLRSSFDGIYYAAALGASKSDQAFYRSVELAVDLGPEAIFFIDDNVINISVAQSCGWMAAVWTGQRTLRALMHQEHWNGG